MEANSYLAMRITVEAHATDTVQVERLTAFLICPNYLQERYDQRCGMHGEHTFIIKRRAKLKIYRNDDMVAGGHLRLRGARSYATSFVLILVLLFGEIPLPSLFSQYQWPLPGAGRSAQCSTEKSLVLIYNLIHINDAVVK